MPVPTLTLYLRDNCRPCKTTAAYNLIELFYKDKRETRKPKGNTLIGLPYWQLGWEHQLWISISIEGCITLFLSFFRVFFCFFATHLNDSIVAIAKPNHVGVSYSTGEGREGGRTVAGKRNTFISYNDKCSLRRIDNSIDMSRSSSLYTFLFPAVATSDVV